MLARFVNTLFGVRIIKGKLGCKWCPNCIWGHDKRPSIPCCLAHMWPTISVGNFGSIGEGDRLVCSTNITKFTTNTHSRDGIVVIRWPTMIYSTYFMNHTYFMATSWKEDMFIGVVWKHKNWFGYGALSKCTCLQIPIYGPQHHNPKGFHGPCGDVVGPISRIITIHSCVWTFGGLTLKHYIVGGTRFGWCWPNGYGDIWITMLRPFSIRYTWWFVWPMIETFLGAITFNSNHSSTFWRMFLH